MALVDIVLRLAAVVVALHVVCALTLLGKRPWRAGAELRDNVSASAGLGVVLGVVLAVNSVVRNLSVELSWIIGLNITGYIHALEGALVADLQSLASPALTAYFSFVYVYGYTFLLTFPVVAYLLADDARPLRVTLIAYILNYGLGLVCYVLFVAYGPRNFMPDLVEPLLYANWPQSQLLVSQVNTNTNVFPSLHTSLSVTVGLLAYQFRRVYPRWLPVAALLAASITLSTMYLGIHWVTDVVAGIGLAALSVVLASRIEADAEGPWRLDATAIRRLTADLRRRRDS